MKRDRTIEVDGDNAVMASQHSESSTWFTRLLSPQIVLMFILLLGASIRIWGIWDRNFNDSDVSSSWNAAEFCHLAWKWLLTDAHKTVSLSDFNKHCMGDLCQNDDNAKPMYMMLKALVIAITGQRSITTFSLIDIAFAVGAMALMLRWCCRELGLRVAVLAGCLWLVGGSQFIDTGRGYDYSTATFFFTATMYFLVSRRPDGLYRTMLMAGASLSFTLLFHIKLVLPFLPFVAVIVVLWKNPNGIKGKIREVACFGVGLLVPVLLMFVYYRGFARLTGVEWLYALPRHLSEGKIDGGPLFNRINPVHLANDWFVMSYVNGGAFILVVILGVLIATCLHVKRDRFTLWMFNDQLFAITAWVLYGGLFWGCYYYKCPRDRMLEISAWPVLAAVGVHYSANWVSRNVLKGRFLTGLQTVLVLAIVANQWVHTAPMLRMGSGIHRAMDIISREGKTATGEGDFAVWPCTMKIKTPLRVWESCKAEAPQLSQWECYDDFLETNGFDYVYVDNCRILSFIITYPGAGNPLMLDTYNRLAASVIPVWRFDYGAPLYANFEHDRTDWTKQWITWETWKGLHKETTPLDCLVMNINYFDVYRAADVIRANRQSRIQLLAQLMAMQRKNPSEFNQVAPRFYNFIQYNSTNQVIMRQAQAISSRF